MTSATAAGKEWLATHARIVDGKTVLDVGGKQRTLHHDGPEPARSGRPGLSPAGSAPASALGQRQNRIPVLALAFFVRVGESRLDRD